MPHLPMLTLLLARLGYAERASFQRTYGDIRALPEVKR